MRRVVGLRRRGVVPSRPSPRSTRLSRSPRPPDGPGVPSHPLSLGGSERSFTAYGKSWLERTGVPVSTSTCPNWTSGCQTASGASTTLDRADGAGVDRLALAELQLGGFSARDLRREALARRRSAGRPAPRSRAARRARRRRSTTPGEPGTVGVERQRALARSRSSTMSCGRTSWPPSRATDPRKRHDEVVGGPLVERHRVADLLDAALVEHRDPVGDVERLLLVVGDEHGRDVHLVVQAAQPLAQVGAHLGVEGTERLVEQQHLRVDGERPGQRHPLALAAGELGRVAVLEARRARRSRAARRPSWRSRPWAACGSSGRRRRCRAPSCA